MGEGFGLGDGMNDLGSTRALAERAAKDAQPGRAGRVVEGRWPELGTVVRVAALVLLGIVLSGWVLTVLNT